MLQLRPAAERGAGHHGWLETRHSFSFAGYYDAAHMGFRSLRVINEDRVVGGKGFGTHGHRDMEIVSYVIDGALEHEDSMGHGSIIRPGEVQRMSAGTGVLHSEYNHSASDPVHFLQIWILPSRQGLSPSYEQKQVADGDAPLRLIVSPDGQDGSVTVHQDARIFLARPRSGESVELVREAGRHLWLQVVRGTIDVNGHTLSAGDGASTSDETALTLRGDDDAEALLFDLA